MKYLTDLTQSYVKEILNYTPETGIFVWLVHRYRYHIGDIAGSINSKGYLIITINGKKYKASRLAHLYMTGEWPQKDMDHDNTLRHDNRWENLREASTSQNCFNHPVKITNKLGVKGVYFYRGMYRAQIQINKIKIFLGQYETLAEAKEAHDKAANELQGEFVHSSIAKEVANASKT